MPTYVAIDASFQWIRTALVENGILTDIYEESPEHGRLKGNIYRGIIRRIDSKIQAAFVRFGPSRDGFLPLKDARRSEDGDAFKEGAPLLVQVTKDEMGDKGAALTTRLSLSGRALVYLPDKEGDGGVSSRLGDEERSRLRAVMQDLKIPDGASVILRTAALSKSHGDLQADLDRLALVEKEIRDAYEKRKEPGLLWREAPPVTRYLREYWQKGFDKVVVNTEEALAECRNFFSQHEPEDWGKVELSPHGPALFERLGLEETIARLESPKVTLASGANIVIERTEALVSIDVNSARSKPSDGGREVEENIFKINSEAAIEVARQIRLRDLGGVIVVDFIDMQEPRHRLELESLMKALCARDKAKIKVYGLSPLGLMEINRQRLRKIPETRELPPCPECYGQGRMEAVETQALKALRLLAARLAERPGEVGASLTLPPEVASRLWNEHRQDIEGLEDRFRTRIRLEIGPSATRQFAFHWVAASKPAARLPKGASPRPPDPAFADDASSPSESPLIEPSPSGSPPLRKAAKPPSNPSSNSLRRPKGREQHEVSAKARPKKAVILSPETLKPGPAIPEAEALPLPGKKDLPNKKSRSRRRKRRGRR